MSSTHNYFKGPEELHFFHEAIPVIISILNSGRTMKMGPTSVHASRDGYRICFDGMTLAKGKTGRELAESFKAAVDKAKQK